MKSNFQGMLDHDKLSSEEIPYPLLYFHVRLLEDGQRQIRLCNALLVCGVRNLHNDLRLRRIQKIKKVGSGVEPC